MFTGNAQLTDKYFEQVANRLHTGDVPIIQCVLCLGSLGMGECSKANCCEELLEEGLYPLMPGEFQLCPNCNDTNIDEGLEQRHNCPEVS